MNRDPFKASSETALLMMRLQQDQYQVGWSIAVARSEWCELQNMFVVQCMMQ